MGRDKGTELQLTSMNESLKRDWYVHDDLVTENTSDWLNWRFHIQKQRAAEE